MQTYDFATPRPVELFVEIGAGSVRVRATGTATTRVEVTGRHEDDCVVEQRGDVVAVTIPRGRRGLFDRDGSLQVEVALPEGSAVTTRLGSADLAITGPVGEATLQSGSGDVHAERLGGPALVQTGSGDITVGAADGELRVKSGSGEVRLGRTTGSVVVSTGSGDVSIEANDATAVVKTGSGDLRLGELGREAQFSSGSGDLRVDRAASGRITAKGASTDVRVGIPAGTPVWTDISSVTGRIQSTLRGTGQPAEGDEHVEVRATTVSGDVSLLEV
ncbi:DUF4097 family beta strand repeat-containing protein [Nocardioides sp. SYSU D00038]|uniref:DUF4097 family beta strand repeat-containing protein n=1 Tax=Nocardioides sp. SYSU D00038 TaxID=2812554 RepID=UPI001967E29B|nr:DUF4097 family beta strand repeat-containing protein [Nocardioides sp. SYSU D00038]